MTWPQRPTAAEAALSFVYERVLPPGKTQHMYSRTSRWKRVLREVFAYRCAYCTIHELETGGPWAFQVDHFVPKRKCLNSALRRDFLNLVYCCSDCNQMKGGRFVTSAQTRAGYRLTDPGLEQRYPGHIQQSEDDRLVGISRAGKTTVKMLALDREPLQEIYRERRAKVERFNKRLRIHAATVQELADGALARQHLAGGEAMIRSTAVETMRLMREEYEHFHRTYVALFF